MRLGAYQEAEVPEDALGGPMAVGLPIGETEPHLNTSSSRRNEEPKHSE